MNSLAFEWRAPHPEQEASVVLANQVVFGSANASRLDFESGARALAA